MRRVAVTLTALLVLTGAPAGAAEKKKGGGVSFIQLPTLTASLLHGDGSRGVLTVEAGLDIPDARLRDRADKSRPRLQDAYVRAMLNYAPGLPEGRPPSPDVIGAALQRATDQTLGAPGARVLLGSILVN